MVESLQKLDLSECGDGKPKLIFVLKVLHLFESVESFVLQIFGLVDRAVSTATQLNLGQFVFVG